jgi:putative folate metabolism gamma-glutamate ligase
LLSILDTYLPPLAEGDVLAVTSKIVSICQGRVVKKSDNVDKHALARREAQYYLEPGSGRHPILLTITRNILIATAGIDESNGDGSYILWPDHVQEVAQTIWEHLREKHRLTQVGVLITDSHTSPLRRGVTGLGLAWCGFRAINNYTGALDVFGRPLRVTTTNVLDGLAAAAVLTMGEGAEQTPLALIRDVPFVSFQERPPNEEEHDEMRIAVEDDLYAPLLQAVEWQAGGALYAE